MPRTRTEKQKTRWRRPIDAQTDGRRSQQKLQKCISVFDYLPSAVFKKLGIDFPFRRETNEISWSIK